MKVVTELATGHELVALVTCDVMENVVAMSLFKITEVGKTHLEYVNTRFTNATVSVPIQLNKPFVHV